MSTKTSTKGSLESLASAGGAECKERAMARSARYGEMNDVRAMVEESAKSLATLYETNIRPKWLPPVVTLRYNVPLQSAECSHFDLSPKSPSPYSSQIEHCHHRGGKLPVPSAADAARGLLRLWIYQRLIAL